VENVTFVGLKPVKAETPLSSHDFKQQTSSHDYKNQAKCHDLKKSGFIEWLTKTSGKSEFITWQINRINLVA
jgi:hypothetical protein